MNNNKFRGSVHLTFLVSSSVVVESMVCVCVRVWVGGWVCLWICGCVCVWVYPCGCVGVGVSMWVCGCESC